MTGRVAVSKSIYESDLNQAPKETAGLTIPIIIDVEASGFGRGSYPIEVGTVNAQGDAHCSIIRPEPDWLHWDDKAEKLHGISRQVLEEHGRAPIDVARDLNQWLAGQVVYSDAWGNDISWLGLLYETAGISQHFQLESLRSLISEEQMTIWHQIKEQVIKDSSCQRHRASCDALILQKTYVITAQITQAKGAG